MSRTLSPRRNFAREKNESERRRRKGSKQSSRLSLNVCGRNLLILDIFLQMWYNPGVKSRRGCTEKEKDMENNEKIKLKDLGLPERIEKKLLAFVNRVKILSKTENILLIGSPEKYLFSIVEALANELNVDSELVDSRVFMKNKQESAFVGALTKMCNGDVVCFTHIESLKHESIRLLEQSIITYGVDITIGQGPAERKIHIDLANVNAVVAVDDMSQVPTGLLEEFYEIIDFKKYDHELRLMLITDFADKYNLKFDKDVTERLARQFTNDEQLKMQLIEIRNQAYESKVLDITESFLQGSFEPISNIDEIDSMDGREFELFTGNLLRANGFENISVTQSSYDFGADVIAEKDDIRYAIQCKRYNGAIGVSAVQEVIASKSLHDCHVACVLTNSTYTPAAIELAKKNLVILWDRTKLQMFIDKANK